MLVAEFYRAYPISQCGYEESDDVRRVAGDLFLADTAGSKYIEVQRVYGNAHGLLKDVWYSLPSTYRPAAMAAPR